MSARESNQKLLGHAGMLSVMTLASRVLGMLRDVVCASVFGTGMIWDAFIYAFTIPNFLRRALGEGTLSACFIPVYSEVLKKEGEKSAERVANNLFTLLFLTVSALNIVVIGATFLVRQFIPLGEAGLLTTKLIMILFPYILFLSLYALSMAILNTKHQFFASSLGPIILNSVWIASILYVAPKLTSSKEGQVTILAWSLLLAGFLQFAVQLIPLFKGGFQWRWHFSLTEPAARKIFKLFIPATMGFAAMQVDVLVDRTLAIFLGAGANSALWYGTRLVQFPMGLFAIAMGTALLPKLSEHAAEENLSEFNRTLSFSLRTVFMLVNPAAAGLVAMGIPIVHVLFQRGAFDQISTFRSAATLQAYAIGLFAYSGLQLVVSAFYALKDTRTPVTVASSCIALNVIMDLIMMGPLKEMGLALSTAIAGIINFSVLVCILHRSRCRIDYQNVMTTFFKSLAASIATAFWSIACFNGMGGIGGSTWDGILRLSVSIGSGMLVYVALCFLLRMSEARQILGLLIRRFYASSRESP